LLKRTGSVEAVQRDLGHKYLSTTLLYIMGIIPQQIPESGKK
jgi:site-specific recombinase XerC